jgi:tetratricopeptide (TPR) repeat protein
MFVDVPGHIFLLVDTGVHERNRFALGVSEDRYAIHADEVWIPLETTALSKGFAEAWRIGAESYRGWSERSQVQLVDVLAAQSRYEPGEPSGDSPTPTLDPQTFHPMVTRDLVAFSTGRQAFLTSRYGDAKDAVAETPEAMNEIAYVYYTAGRFEEAETALRRMLGQQSGTARTWNNLGTVYAARGDLGKATEAFQAAVGAESVDPGIWLNLGLTRYASGDSAGADESLGRGIGLSGGYAEACALLGLAAEEGAAREGTARMSAEEARELLKAALRRVPQASANPGAREATPSKPDVTKKRWSGRTAGGRSADRTEMADLLYWKRR